MNIEINEYEEYLEHLIIKDVDYYDSEESILLRADLDICGRHIKVLFKGGAKKTSIFYTEMYCTFAESGEEFSSYRLPNFTINGDDGLFFRVSEQQAHEISQYFSKANEIINTIRQKKQETEIREFIEYSEFVSLGLSKLVEHLDEILDSTINFIDGLQYINITKVDTLMALTLHMAELDSNKNEGFLPASPETLISYKDKNKVFIMEEEKNIRKFFDTDFSLFKKFLQEKFNDIDDLIAFLFLVNIAIQHASNQWDDDFNEIFSKAEGLELNTDFELFMNLDSINIYDDSVQGKFFCYLAKNKKFKDYDKILDNVDIYKKMLEAGFDNKNFNNFKKSLQKNKEVKRYSIDMVDLMNGQEFESFVSLLFSNMGYKTEITKATGDQGIDVLAEKNEDRIGVQAKCYSGTVGNSAVQEAVSGKAFYRLDKVIVVTNSTFSESAKKLAQVNDVILWDRTMLKEKIIEFF